MESDEGRADIHAAALIIQHVAPHLTTPTEIDVRAAREALDTIEVTRHRLPTEPIGQEFEAKLRANAALRQIARAQKHLDRGEFGQAEDALHLARRHSLIAMRNARLLDQRNPVGNSNPED